jgi:hypothetical protein
MTDAHVAYRGTASSPVVIGTKYVRWGLGLFLFGLLIGFGPWLHYMHGALEEVQPTFLKNVTLWFVPWTLPVYVTQLGGLGMVVIGLCYLSFARDKIIISVTGGERLAPVLCAVGILAEFLFGFPFWFAANAVWPSLNYAPIDAGKWTWLGTQGASIAVYVIGVMFADGGISRASLVLRSARAS